MKSKMVVCHANHTATLRIGRVINAERWTEDNTEHGLLSGVAFLLHKGVHSTFPWA